ncbi:hypothetical protein PTTG_00462 [Puccinia triticina 1-1 BBBD Race 1]|uniref:ATP-dependent RNA helicase n=2 Tax=Puccinia triticina TaxID=208348 RepID=A0A180H4R1_PUCT1|nr:hypothetical protein PTTG_00462 [Puccinia triticina 1-1 BBBD Race 1]
MADLILNFETDPAPSHTKTRHIQTTPGSWTHKHKQKRRAKHLDKLKAVDVQPKDTPQSQPQNLKRNHNHDQDTSPKDIQPSTDTPTQPESRKKAKLDHASNVSKPSGRLQIISSLFSSTIIPTIKPISNDEQSSMVVYAPSNASLSEIQVTSPSLKLHPQISKHLSSSAKVGPVNSPTAIQSIAWPLLCAQSNTTTRDIIVQSETGSGKTLAYLVPIIQDLLTLAQNHSEIGWSREIGTLAIILVPTRELAEQVYHVAIDLLSFAQRSGPSSKDLEGKEPQAEDAKSTEREIAVDGLNPRWLVPGTLHGGTNRTHEKARLRRGLPLLVCTPGRLLDHLEKTVSLRMAGEPIPPSNDPKAKPKVDSRSIGHLNLRWLVVDEADRLMDMGFEEQMRGILKHLTDREAKSNNPNKSSSNPRRTILCSATMPDGVKKLVGLSLNDPILLRAAGHHPDQDQAEHSSGDAAATKTENTTFSAPTQLSQYYVLTPPKLRLVSLIALLRRITDSKQKKPAEKVLVFMSCTTSVDFHFEAIGSPSAEAAQEATAAADDKKTEPNKLVKQSKFLPGVKIFRLHGNLDLQTRLASLNAFSNSDTKSEGSSILLCTSLAGRGLDVPFVSHVIQYDLPTEGGVTEYLHRVGRTARAGQAGEAWSFLLPSESGWVDWCESNQNESAAGPKLKEVGVQKVLNDGFGGKSQKEWEVRATDAQMMIERWVIGNEENRNLASMAFSSHIRAYATHPSQEKQFFHVKNLHLGHLAKSFGLREPPKKITTMYPQQTSKATDRRQHQAQISKNTTVRRKSAANEARDSSGSDSEDDDGHQDHPTSFKALSQFKHAKNGNTLRGPIFNTIDEFNLG